MINSRRDRMNIKRTIILLFTLLLTVSFYGCAASGSADTEPATTVTAGTTAAQLQVPATEVTVPTTTVNIPSFDPAKLAAQVPENVQRKLFYHFRSVYHLLKQEEVSLRAFGVFEGVYVVMVDGSVDFPAISYQETVNDLLFYYQTGQTLMVCVCESEITTVSDLTEAFCLGVITPEQLEIVYENYYSAYPHLYDQSKNVTRFTDGIRNEISTLWLNQYGEELDWTEKHFFGGYRNQHYGSVGGKQVFMRTAYHPRVIAAVDEIRVGGCSFQHYFDFEIYVYKEGTLLTLKEAFEQGMISETEIEALYHYHRLGDN